MFTESNQGRELHSEPSHLKNNTRVLRDGSISKSAYLKGMRPEAEPPSPC